MMQANGIATLPQFRELAPDEEERELDPPFRPISAIWARLRLTAAPPFLPASRASPEVNWCAVPFSCAAFPPILAISRCFSGVMAAKPLFAVLLPRELLRELDEEFLEPAFIPLLPPEL
jgi:hypothetical protein